MCLFFIDRLKVFCHRICATFVNLMSSRSFFIVSRLMGGGAGGSMGHAMTNMSSLAACSVTDSKPMQFPLAQRRKRRVLFTQAQVSHQRTSILNRAFKAQDNSTIKFFVIKVLFEYFS